MLELNPKNRIKMKDILEHDYFKQEPLMSVKSAFPVIEIESHEFQIRKNKKAYLQHLVGVNGKVSSNQNLIINDKHANNGMIITNNNRAFSKKQADVKINQINRKIEAGENSKNQNDFLDTNLHETNKITNDVIKNHNYERINQNINCIKNEKENDNLTQEKFIKEDCNLSSDNKEIENEIFLNIVDKKENISESNFLSRKRCSK